MGGYGGQSADVGAAAGAGGGVMDEGFEYTAENDPVVEHLRQLFAKVVQEMEELRRLSGAGELQRACSVAITQAETAEMWAVRAATWRYRQ